MNSGVESDFTWSHVWIAMVTHVHDNPIISLGYRDRTLRQNVSQYRVYYICRTAELATKVEPNSLRSISFQSPANTLLLHWTCHQTSATDVKIPSFLVLRLFRDYLKPIAQLQPMQRIEKYPQPKTIVKIFGLLFKHLRLRRLVVSLPLHCPSLTGC